MIALVSNSTNHFLLAAIKTLGSLCQNALLSRIRLFLKNMVVLARQSGPKIVYFNFFAYKNLRIDLNKNSYGLLLFF